MTSIETKMQILHDLYMEYGNEYPDFIEVHDIGVPLSVLTIIGCATPTPRGIQDIESTFDNWCEFLELDKYGDYSSVEEMIEFDDEQG